jgi:hypothetical protein
LYGLIASPSYVTHIHQAIDNVLLFERIGQYSGDEFVKHCGDSSNVKLDILIIDLTCCDDEAALITGIRKYRIARSGRVIILAPGRSPGDPMLAALVSEGIYDIVAPDRVDDPDEEDESEDDPSVSLMLRKQIHTPYHYANGLRWKGQQETTAPEEREKKKNTQRAEKSEKKKYIQEENDDWELDWEPEPVVKRRIETIVYQDRIVGAVSIGVFGATQRTGNTFSAFQMALWLSRNYRTALVEMEAASIRDLVPDSTIGKNHLQIEQLHVFIGGDSETATELLLREWDYVVFDFGNHWRKYLQLFARCQLHVLTAMGGDNVKVNVTIQELLQREWSRPLHLRILCSDSLFKQWDEATSRQDKRELKLHFWHARMVDSPFVEDESWAALLQDVLPRKTKRSGLLGLFGRGKGGSV